MRKLTELFSYEYSQPKEYHFSLDSIEMARLVAEQLAGRKDLPFLRTLDLCAGCGVIGFEIHHLLPQIQIMDFVELQKVFLPHLERNLKITGMDNKETHVLNFNYEELCKAEHAGRYDLIFCNPPYFRIEQGKVPPEEIKYRAKFFVDSNFNKLIEAISNSLSEKGQAFILVRDLSDNGWDNLSEMRALLRGKLFCENIADVRGTFLLKLYRSEE